MAKALSRHADEAYDDLPDERSRDLCALLFKALTERGALGGFALHDLEQHRVVPRFLHETPGAAPHGLHGRVDRAPAGHDHDRQRGVLL